MIETEELDATIARMDAALAYRPAPKAAEAPSVVLVSGADLVPRPVSWLWPYWLALGKLHILAGAPGQGKTTLALAMAATVTKGGRWPDGTLCELGNILIWSGEDDPADTLLPRLLASGALRERCHFIKGAVHGGTVVPFDPARDLEQLRKAIDDFGGVRLLIVDPVVNVVTGDSHKNTETRRALQPLVDLADACDCAVLGITHFAKGGQGADPAQRVIGSVAFTAVARIVLVAAKVQDDEGRDIRVLARAKSNIGPDDGGFEYHLMQSEPLPGIQASCIAWGNPVEGTARELLTDPDAPANKDDDTGSALEAAEAFLRTVLTIPTATQAVRSEAKDAGLAWRTVQRASDRLGVIKRKGNAELGGRWYWSLPSSSAKNQQLSQGGQGQNVGEVGEVAPDTEVL